LGFRHRIRWLSVGYKMFIVYFISMLISVMVTGYLSYNKASEIIQSKVSKVALQTVQQAGKRLDTILEEYENRSQLVMGYKKLQEGIIGEFGDNYERLRTTQEINNFVSNLVNSKNDTINLHILGDRSASFRYSVNNSSGFSVLPPVDPSIKKERWYKQIIEADGRVVWFGIIDPFITVENSLYEKGPVFSFGRALKNLEGKNEIIGVVVYEIDPAQIQDILSEINFNASGSSFIVDPNNRVIGGDGSQKVSSYPEIALPREKNGIMHTALDGDKKIIVLDNLAVNDWKLVGMASTKSLVKEIREIRLYMIYLGIGFMFIAMVLALIVARHIHNPVQTLLQSMRKAREGEFEIQIQQRRNDEFGILFDNFNIMVSRIKSLIDELYVQRLLKKEIQLKMLASQINAHFIYNTLDSIHWISRIHKVDEISTMIFGLSKYLRTSLSDGRDLVSVREVVELLESYLSIQKVRYHDKFEVDMQVDPDLLSYKVLKFMFQPIVENAIYHGLEPKKGKGFLGIQLTKSERVMKFQVIDDGVGISPEKLREIEEDLSDNDFREKNNFALKNINSQIKLTYGKEYPLELESESGIGTKVTIMIPLR
jgi:two-component system sensor histidine kinase YesM